MKRHINSFTIIEALIGITFLALIVGSILGAFILVQQYFKDGIALANSQATARILIEKIVRPDIREGSRFSISTDGNTLTLTKYDSTIKIFTFDNGDGNDSTFEDNTIKENNNIIGANVVKIPDENVFNVVKADEIVGINLGVKHEGVFGHYKEVRIDTEIKLRN